MTNPEIGMLQLGLFIFVILLGFPIAFTLMAMAIGFGLYAMGPRIFDLLVTNTADVMQNDVLTAASRCSCSWAMWSNGRTFSIDYSTRYRWRPRMCPARLLSRRSSPARAIRYRNRHCRRRRHLDGPARVSGHAARRLRHELAAGVVCAGGCPAS